MTETAWTLGPLAVDPVRAWIVCSQLDDDGDPCPVAALAWPTKYRSEEETFANAQLYAAAPDLYESAVEAFTAMETACAHLLYGGDREAMSALRRVADDLQDALARARGETL